MGLLSFLKRNAGDPNAAVPATEPADSVQQARVRARQRLIGAAVLVLLGVIGFSLLFETQPRPVPVDVPIEIARRDGVPGTSTPPIQASARRAPAAVEPPAREDERGEAVPRVSPEPITESAAEAGRELPAAQPAAVPASRPAPAAAAEPRETRRPPEPRTPASAPAPARSANDGARAQALLEGRNAPAAAGRFVVQVGAFAETNAAREARQKVEKLGLKTYTQVVETSAGNRIRVRVGPFASREEADRAAGKIKSAGLPSSVLTL